ncbi:MAG: efflux RND transporter permease subunit, partial [Gammaproteobacteria bacterium]|nr:efflux RND transporter permease subunit [Gammaproteobacteria bacterium]
QDLPAGLIGEQDASRELRSLNQIRSVKEFKQLAVINEDNNYLTLGDFAEVDMQIALGQETIKSAGNPAVVLSLQRNESGDSLKSAEILHSWVEDVQGTLPPNIKLQVFSERWQLIKQRIMLLVKNGAGGLVLVLLILYLFLSPRVAFWVAVGIPVSFMATLAVLYSVGGTINMISLFALIMALGIIVDDAIVVGEDAQAHFDQGEDPLLASEGGAKRMLSPVMASSLTTIAAFLPLMIIGGRMGSMMMSIPIVIISVIIASLIESFLILPGHLKNAFKGVDRDSKSKIRTLLDNGFDTFKEKYFRSLVILAVEYRGVTIALAIALLIFSLSLFAGGRIAWQFFVSPESTTVFANVRFVAGTSEKEVGQYINHVEQALEQTQKQYDEKVVDTYYVLYGASSGRQGRSKKGGRIASIYVELLPSSERVTTNKEFIKSWKKRVKTVAAIENFTIASRRNGPSESDVDVKLIGTDPNKLKLAALSLQQTLAEVEGVSAIDDDLPYGREQLIYDLTDEGRALGMTIKELGQQIRNAYSGQVIQRFQRGVEEIEVRLQLALQEQNSLNSLQQLPIKLKSGDIVPLETVAKWRAKQGFEVLRHSDGILTVSITATVDEKVNNTQEITNQLTTEVLPEIVQLFGVDFDLGGNSSNQKETLNDMKIGVVIALLLMYFVLTWVFSSYGWSILVMLTIPLGLTGAILGHWAMGMDLTILSLFGFFALSGIVVNDSIILVTFYKHVRKAGLSINEAVVEAACQRLRAVLLTSLTTIAGLTPLLFETSRQAQFLIPMATSIAFGLSFATLLILFVIPAFLSIYEETRDKFRLTKMDVVK